MDELPVFDKRESLTDFNARQSKYIRKPEHLVDDMQGKNPWMKLHDKQILSSTALCEKIGINYDQEVERMRFEQAALDQQAKSTITGYVTAVGQNNTFTLQGAANGAANMFVTGNVTVGASNICNNPYVNFAAANNHANWTVVPTWTTATVANTCKPINWPINEGTVTTNFCSTYQYDTSNDNGKVNCFDSSAQQATEADIADVQQQLAQTVTDPNAVFVTGHAFMYDPTAASNSAVISPIRPKNHIGFGPKRVTAKHQAHAYQPQGFYVGGYQVQMGVAGAFVQTAPPQEQKLRSFEGTVFGRIEVQE